MPLGLCLPGGASFPPTPVEFTHFTAGRCHETGASGGMHNPNGSSVLEHALQIATLARPLVEAIQRKDRDLASWFFNHSSASQVRRAVSSIALNAAEGRGAVGGNARIRFETALGSLYEAQAGFQLAVAWHYVDHAAAQEVVLSLHRLGGRLYGLIRR